MKKSKPDSKAQPCSEDELPPYYYSKYCASNDGILTAEEFKIWCNDATKELIENLQSIPRDEYADNLFDDSNIILGE